MMRFQCFFFLVLLLIDTCFLSLFKNTHPNEPVYTCKTQLYNVYLSRVMLRQVNVKIYFQNENFKY